MHPQANSGVQYQACFPFPYPTRDLQGGCYKIQNGNENGIKWNVITSGAGVQFVWY